MTSQICDLAAPLSAGTAAPDLSVDGIRRFVKKATGGRVHVRRAGWISLYRPQVRMVDRYRVGRVLLAGDAAHVHPPAGGQGLNTGVQDAYNLGSKLAHVLDGGPDSLLESYQTERLPVAAAVLGLSKRLLLSGSRRRDAVTNQLELNYRGGPLAREISGAPGRLHAGDRAPDASCEDWHGKPIRLFDIFRGPHFTLLAFDRNDRIARTADARWGPDVRAVRVVQPGCGTESDDLVDAGGYAHAAYGVCAVRRSCWCGRRLCRPLRHARDRGAGGRVPHTCHRLEALPGTTVPRNTGKTSHG